MYENLQRILLRNILIPLATLLFGSIWFALSILSYFIGLFLPPTQHTLPSLPQPRRSSGTSGRPAANPVAPLPSILSSRKDSPQHHVRFPNTVPQPTHRPRAVKRWSSPAGLEVPPPLASREVIPFTDVPQTDASVSTAPSAFSINKVLSQLATLDSESQSPSPLSRVLVDEPTLSLSRNSSMSMPAECKNSLTRKLPNMNVFRSRSKRVKSEGGGPSRSGSISSSVASTPPSTPPVVMLDLKADPEKGSTSTFSSAEPPARSGFIHPFKFRPKRASASATMSASADISSGTTMHEALSTLQQPSPPSSPDREAGPAPPVSRSRSQSRRKAFVSYLNLSVQTHQRPATADGSSPRTAALEGSLGSAQSRSLFSPATPKSLCPKKQIKTPSGPAPRTQPYGYPYFAMMPNGEYAEVPAELQQQSARRRSFAGSLPNARRGSIDGVGDKANIEHTETPLTATPANTLGLELGLSATTRTSRHRQMASLS